MSAFLSEDDIEQLTMGYFAGLGYTAMHARELGPDRDDGKDERISYADVLLLGRLRAAIARLNPDLPAEVQEDAIRKLTNLDSRQLVASNRTFHQWLVEGVPAKYTVGGQQRGVKVQLLDYANPAANDLLAVNQLTVIESGHERRPDIVVFVNGLPLAVIELKSPSDERADLRAAYNQLQTYKKEIPSLMVYNELPIISDGPHAAAGSLTTNRERFLPWRTIDGSELAPLAQMEIAVLVKGIFAPSRLLDLIRYFVTFADDGSKLDKKIAAYHQYHAVNKAVAATVQAVRGNRKIGVVWHTQGSGKSLSMLYYAGKLRQHPELANPTLVVITDRNDLDDQLFDTFAAGADVLRGDPVQADSRADLRAKLNVDVGGVIFTTIQKFAPEKGESQPQLSARQNVIVIADEAHRSQYDFLGGFASNLRDALPHASFIGFSGTPVETADRSTRSVFGDYIDTYDIQQAVEDQATVPIYYEGRWVQLELDEAERPHVDPDFEEATEGEEQGSKEQLKQKWSRLEALVGSDRRIEQVASDIVTHFAERTAALVGKGMIVCMSRALCVKLYDEIIKLHPEWHSSDDNAGAIKVVISGSAADDAELQPHIRSKRQRDAVARHFKDPDDSLKLVIVRDMWLTGFDVPPLHTMYLDKPMRGHNLMQAIARVNRVFRDKPGGLIVDYLGIADFLRQALSVYSQQDRNQVGMDQEQARVKFIEEYEIVQAMFYGFDYLGPLHGSVEQKTELLLQAMEHILNLTDGKNRFLDAVLRLAKAFVLSVPHPDVLKLRDEVAFFQTVRAQFLKSTPVEGRDSGDMDAAIQQIVSRAIAPAGVSDIFTAAGLSRPDVSVLSEEFLADVANLPQRNLALEALAKLLADQIKSRARTNVVQARSFADLLRRTVAEYQNRSRTAAEVISELIKLARDIREEQQRGVKMQMSEAEVAFYDALTDKESAYEVLSDSDLQDIARELVVVVKRNASVDWTLKQNVRARLRVAVKRVLRERGYPPDKQRAAATLILKQAEAVGRGWAA